VRERGTGGSLSGNTGLYMSSWLDLDESIPTMFVRSIVCGVRTPR
jgi:hypothetical protein